MKILFLSLISASYLATISPAYAQETCGNSYIVLPDGTCLNMTYLTVLSNARRNNASINQLYQDQFDLNVQLEVNPYYVETEEERDERYRSLAETSLVKEDINRSTQDLEATLFPIHTQALEAISGTMR